MSLIRLSSISICIVILSGCSIKQEVKSVAPLNNKEICIIENPPVREGFLATYNHTLTKKGYKVKLIPQDSSLDTCKVVSTYMGRWSWDLAIYLAYAEINVYKNGELIGNALYDSRSGSANMGKFIKGEEKIIELTNKLFP